MSRFVFFSADRSTIEVHIGDNFIGRADDAGSLRKLLVDNGVTLHDDMAKSSSIDFCEEYGFVEGGAQRIIDRALAKM